MRETAAYSHAPDVKEFVALVRRPQAALQRPAQVGDGPGVGAVFRAEPLQDRRLEPLGGLPKMENAEIKPTKKAALAQNTIGNSQAITQSGHLVL